jgi:heavy metal translocating P-type ATPase
MPCGSGCCGSNNISAVSTTLFRRDAAESACNTIASVAGPSSPAICGTTAQEAPDSDPEAECCAEEESKCAADCCTYKQPACTESCCEEEFDDIDEQCRSTKSSPAQGCCLSSKKGTLIDVVETNPSETVDVEKARITIKEHLILSVSGMTCTGCETKLRRTLGTLDYITTIKTSLVLARIELDLLPGPASAEDVIKHLHRTTEFKCERVSNSGSWLNLLCPSASDATAVIQGEWPKGVLEVKLVDKQTIRVTHDANSIGARHLLEQPWASNLRLAPQGLNDPSLDAGSQHVRDMGLLTLLSAILTIPVLVLAWAPLPSRPLAYSSASLALATIVQIVIAGPFYPKALKALIFSKVIEMDLLIVLSTSAAYVFSIVAFGYQVSGRPLSTGQFFETSTLLVTLIMVGRWVSSLARQKAAESISIRGLQAHGAVIIEGADEREIDARLLQYGDVFNVSPETKIPTDGTVVSGLSEVDESMLTGEATPVLKNPGSSVIAGSINGSGLLTVRLTRLPGDNTITTIACMVDEAKLSKPKVQDIADRVASYFVPVVVGLTIITFVIWVAIGVAVRKQSGAEATITAITYAITVLIVSCPCAIGLAVPMVIVVASGVAARRGVIFKTAESIEIAHKTTDVVFDKTGTLTMGKLAVVDEQWFGDDEEKTKAMLKALVTGVKHPVSMAVAAHLTAENIAPMFIQDAQARPGKGLEATFRSQTLRAGNSRWLNLSSHSSVHPILSEGLTAFCFTIDSRLFAVLGLRDTLRPDAHSTLRALESRGLCVHILSGDDDAAVRKVAGQLGIESERVRSRCAPGDKQAYIKKLLDPSSPHGKKEKKVIMFVGDGTNDAPALAQADLGVHISSGTDMASSAADIVLIRSDLSCILTLIVISKAAMNRVKFNFTWSFVYNLFAILLGAGAFVNARIPPEYAGLGELVSVLPVIGVAVALRWVRV